MVFLGELHLDTRPAGMFCELFTGFCYVYQRKPLVSLLLLLVYSDLGDGTM